MNKAWFSLFSFSLIILTPLSNLGTDIYTPSLPLLVNVFHTTTYLMKLSVTIYLIFYGIGQLIFGILSDYLGRRAILLPGIMLFTLASILTIFSTNIWFLLWLRVCQGLGAAIISVISKAMISDSYEGQAMENMSNYKVTLQIGSMVFAPLIGGVIQQYFNWHWNFIILAMYGLVGFCLTFFCLPETIHRNKFNLKHFWHNFSLIILDKRFLNVTTLAMLIYSIAGSVGVLGSFYIQNTLKLSPTTFGVIALILGSTYMFGSIVFKISWFKKNIKPEFYLLLTTFIFSFTTILAKNNIYIFTISIAVIMFFSGLLLPNIMHLALAHLKTMPGFPMLFLEH